MVKIKAVSEVNTSQSCQMRRFSFSERRRRDRQYKIPGLVLTSVVGVACHDLIGAVFKPPFPVADSFDEASLQHA
jgi:hypothetical protein